MTPNDRASEAARKVVLVRIEKCRQRGMWRATTSTQIMHAPSTTGSQLYRSEGWVEADAPQAAPLAQARIQPRSSLEIPIELRAVGGSGSGSGSGGGAGGDGCGEVAGRAKIKKGSGLGRENLDGRPLP